MRKGHPARTRHSDRHRPRRVGAFRHGRRVTSSPQPRTGRQGISLVGLPCPIGESLAPSGRLRAAAAKERIIAITAAQAHISREEATRRFDAQTRLAQAKNQAAQAARNTADASAGAALKGAFLGFAVPALGAGASALGGGAAVQRRALVTQQRLAR